MTHRAWVSSSGGPLLLLPVTHLAEWQGTEAAIVPYLRGEDDRPSDYERACAVDDYTGVIPVGSSEALAHGLSAGLASRLWRLSAPARCSVGLLRGRARRQRFPVTLESRLRASATTSASAVSGDPHSAMNRR